MINLKKEEEKIEVDSSRSLAKSSGQYILQDMHIFGRKYYDFYVIYL